MRYGYINEGGYLREVSVDGMKQERLQEYVNAGWKPVDELDNERLKSEDGYIVVVKPYDAGDRISFEYEVKVDIKARRDEISVLKAKLSGSDYKIIKCYESSLLGDDAPYNLAELHQERQSIRDRINVLEESINAL